MDLMDLKRPRADFFLSVVLLDFPEAPAGPELSLSLAASLLSNLCKPVSKERDEVALWVGAEIVSERCRDDGAGATSDIDLWSADTVPDELDDRGEVTIDFISDVVALDSGGAEDLLLGNGGNCSEGEVVD